MKARAVLCSIIVQETESWDIEGIGKTLGTSARATSDPIAGEGYQIDLSYANATLELFPETLVVRYRDSLTYLEMLDANIRHDGGLKLVSEGEKTRTVLQIYRPDGTIVFAGGPPRREVGPDGGEWMLDSFATVRGKISGSTPVVELPSGSRYLKVTLAEEVEGQPISWHLVRFWNAKIEKFRPLVEKAHSVHEVVAVSGYRKVEECYSKGERRYRTIRYINGVRIENSK